LEVNPQTPHPVINMVTGQAEILRRRAYGGTMRLGRWECQVKEGTLADMVYQKYHGYDNEAKKVAGERHRHRYEVNEKFVADFAKHGLVIAGRSVVEHLVEIIELPRNKHPFFMGTQFHPEYRSRPLSPHPIFLEFIAAAQSQE